MVLTQKKKIGGRDGDTPMDDVNLVAQATTRVNRDPTEAAIHPAKKTQRNENYVDEKPINEGREECSEDEDPEDGGKEKEKDDYYCKPNPTVVDMAKELAKIKLKLAAQEEFSRRMQA
uniref:Uncharacterized protein n=1 Tax=Cannabis sativa TaxID=3483 RepID=A0A803PVH1_CANSA